MSFPSPFANTLDKSLSLFNSLTFINIRILLKPQMCAKLYPDERFIFLCRVREISTIKEGFPAAQSRGKNPEVR